MKKSGQIVKEYRIKHEYSLRNLADKVECSAPTIDKIEKGINKFPKTQLGKKIIEILNISLEDQEAIKRYEDYKKTPETIKKRLKNTEKIITLIVEGEIEIELIKKMFSHNFTTNSDVLMENFLSHTHEKKATTNKESNTSIMKIHDIGFLELPVYSGLVTEDKFIDLKKQVGIKSIFNVFFSKGSFIIDIKSDSMTPEINPGDWVIVDPEEKDVIENKIYLVTYEDKTFIAQIAKPTDEMVILKNFNNTKYPDQYIINENIKKLKIEGRIVKAVTEREY